MLSTATAIRVSRRFLDVALLAFVGFILLTVALERGIPAVTGGSTFVVGGGSMEPTIPLGSAVVSVPVAADALAVGDIVSIGVGPRHAVFTHRIVRTVQRDGALWLETKGDANAAPDPAIIPVSSVIGRVALFVPYAGYVVRVIGTPQGMAFLIALGVCLFATTLLLEGFERDRRRVGRAGQAPDVPAHVDGQLEESGAFG